MLLMVKLTNFDWAIFYVAFCMFTRPWICCNWGQAGFSFHDLSCGTVTLWGSNPAASIPLGFICDHAKPHAHPHIYKMICTVSVVNVIQCNSMQCNVMREQSLGVLHSISSRGLHENKTWSWRGMEEAHVKILNHFLLDGPKLPDSKTVFCIADIKYICTYTAIHIDYRYIGM